MVRSLVAILLVCSVHSVAWAMPQDQTDTAEDTPQVIRYEAIPLAEDVHTTIAGESTATDGHRGCFRDSEVRDLPHQAYEAATNTIEQCRDVCQSFGFRFASVQVKFCFCGNSFGRYGRADNCNAKCPGNNKQTCGGVLASNIFGVSGYAEPKPEGEVEYFGCFRDGTLRDLPHLAYVGSNNIEKCKSACKTLGFRFAAVQYANQCFCGNSFGRYGKADNCNMKCSGNNKQICGGDWASGVFSAAYLKPKPSKHQLLGCYRDRKVRDLPRLAYFGSNSIEKCVSACKKLQMKFAAVQYSYQCWCGNRYGTYGAAGNCNMRCNGNREQICGGFRANSVYNTLP